MCRVGWRAARTVGGYSRYTERDKAPTEVAVDRLRGTERNEPYWEMKKQTLLGR